MGDRQAQPQVENCSYKVIATLGAQIPKQYENLIYSKWLRSLRSGNDYVKLIDSKCYYEAYHRYISHILYRPQTVVRFAILSEDEDVVLGFSVSEVNTLHYVFVQPQMRRQKIGTSLVPFEVKTITNITKTGLLLWNNKAPQAKLNPYA